MATSLYDLTVGSYLQVLGSTAAFMDKGASHCDANGIQLADVVATCLYPDMLSFHFQIVSVVHHSLGAIRGLQAGEFGPPASDTQMDYTDLQALVADAHEEMKAFDADSINALSDGRIVFKLGANEIPFSNENFILSFSLPNVYFHATTAYDILRMQGVGIGKRDFLGQMRMG